VFLTRLRTSFKGTSINEPKYKEISSKFNDFVDIFKDIYFKNGEKLKTILTDNQYNNLKERFNASYKIYTMRDRFTRNENYWYFMPGN